MERFFDMVLSGFALVVLSPLLLALMVLLRFTGEGEVFFRQQRIGLGGEPFELLKFATMLKESPNMAQGTVTVTDDPRILPVGRVLRKLKLNELPQIWNVLRGDMSVIGPRPQTRRCFEAVPEEARDQIVSVPPGLSSPGAIVFRGEEEMYQGVEDPDRFYDQLIMPYKAELERWYAANRSVGLYWLLILTTAWVVVFPRSRVFWRLCPNAPRPPAELAQKLAAPPPEGA
jgi:lipopolysaccharide/colanic/teichoic acid biosynthesis glycosyltransferase